jgi:hypothetical protein
VKRCSAPAGTKAAFPFSTWIRSSSTEHPASFEHDVDLVVLVGRLVVRLGRDEHVDADLEPGRAVNDLVAAGPGLEALLHPRHVEERHGGEPIPRTR